MSGPPPTSSIDRANSGLGPHQPNPFIQSTFNFLPSSSSSSSSSPMPGFPVSSLPDIPSVEDRVSHSTELWARDLGALFEHAKERFGDVVWSTDSGDRIWGHKAVIYARAPKAFKDRYFFSKPFSRSPIPTSPHLLPPLFPPRNTPSPYTTSGSGSASASGPTSGRGSSLSFDTVSEKTLRLGTSATAANVNGNGNGMSGSTLHLTHEDAPELFRAQLEWLYTGEGFGDVVEWISAEDEETGNEGTPSVRDSLGRRGNLADRRDKLGQDLTYMWRSKLYCDVRIHLTPLEPESESSDSDDSTDSFSSTAIFTSHRFLLVSRSPYFASVFLNPSSFRPPTTSSTVDVHLPTPPFTPAALHFCLGWMYAGHLDFSNRSFDLVTAFQIHRAAAYLQLDALVDEVESRITHDFCHGLDYDKCKCRRCPIRASRVWRFAIASDVGAVSLARRARAYIIRSWAESWGKEIGLADETHRISLVNEVIKTIDYQSVISVFRGCEQVRSRMEAGIRNRGRDAGPWVDSLEIMIEQIETRARQVLIDDFTQIAESHQLWDLVSGKGFSDDLLDRVLKEVVDGAGSGKSCNSGPKIYQALVSAILLRVDPDTLEAALPARSRSRQMIEAAKEGVLAHVKRRWMQVRDEGGFLGLETWAIKEISDEIEVPLEELLNGSNSFPIPNSKGVPRTTSRKSSLSEARTPTTSDRISSRPSTLRTRPNSHSQIQAQALSQSQSSRRLLSGSTSSLSQPLAPPSPPQPDGLRRLRLTSSASTASMTSTSARSTRSVSARQVVSSSSSTGATPAGGDSVSVPGSATARSPTAARRGNLVSVGGASRGRQSGTSIVFGSRVDRGERVGSTSPTPSRGSPKTMTGGPKPLLTRATVTPGTSMITKSVPVAESDVGTTESKSGRSPSITSTRSVVSTRATGGTKNITTSQTTGLAVGTTFNPSTLSSTSAKPRKLGPTSTSTVMTSTSSSTRQRTESTSTIGSVRSKAPSIAPSVRSATSRITLAVKSSSNAGASNRPPAPPAPKGLNPKDKIRDQDIQPKSVLSPPTRRQGGSVTGSPRTAVGAGSGSGSKLSSTLSTSSTTRVRVSSTSISNGPGSATSKTLVPSRLRTVSSSITPTKDSTPNMPSTRAASASRSRSAVRSPSGSTEEPVATTPHMSEILDPPAVIRGEDPSDSDLELKNGDKFGVDATLAGDFAQKKKSKDLQQPTRTRTMGNVAARRIALESQAKANAQNQVKPPIRPKTPIQTKPTEPKEIQPPPPPESHSHSQVQSPMNINTQPEPSIQPIVPRQFTSIQPIVPRQFTGRGISLNVGIPCIVLLSSRRARFRANVRYLGQMDGSTGAWVGLEVDDLERLGVETLIDGERDGIRYFYLSTSEEGKLAHRREEGGGKGGVGHGKTEGGGFVDEQKIKERKRRVAAIGESLIATKRMMSRGTGSGSISGIGSGNDHRTGGVVGGHKGGYLQHMGLGINPPKYQSGNNNGTTTNNRLAPPGAMAMSVGRVGSGSSGVRLGDLGERKRSLSPFAIAAADWSIGENPRALFVRPSEVLFVLGAE